MCNDYLFGLVSHSYLCDGFILMGLFSGFTSPFFWSLCVCPMSIVYLWMDAKKKKNGKTEKIESFRQDSPLRFTIAAASYFIWRRVICIVVVWVVAAVVLEIYSLYYCCSKRTFVFFSNCCWRMHITLLFYSFFFLFERPSAPNFSRNYRINDERLCIFPSWRISMLCVAAHHVYCVQTALRRGKTSFVS